MRELERARRVVAAAHARRHADGITLELLESLERENAESRARIDSSQREGHTRTGRYVAGRAIGASILLGALVLVVYWYRFTAEGAAFQGGFERGYPDATARGAVTPVVRADSRVSGAQVADGHQGTAGRGGP